MFCLSISLLGSLQASLDDRPLSFATEKTRALLAYLAVERDRSHSRSALAGLLWPDQPEDKARQNLRQTLLYLRQSLGEDQSGTDALLQASRESVQFDAQAQSNVDIAHFVALDEACRQHRHTRLSACRPCLLRLAQMVELYRGDFLSGLDVDDSDLYQEWALLKREWLRRRAIEALSVLSLYQERRGNYARALGYAQRQVEMEPWHEEAHRALMRLLAFDGQRGAALTQYRACREALDRELDIEPTTETTALFEQIRAGQLQAEPPHNNLPPAAAVFVGRQDELSELAERLAAPDCRLLALVGPGGIGKTRLALQAAADQLGLFAHGVYVVHLAAVPGPDLVMPAIAGVIGCPLSGRGDVRAQLSDYLREKELLLVLDNLEHLLPAAVALVELLKGAPGLKLLITSRERLNLKEAWTYAVEGLPYPSETQAADPSCDAVELFVQSARRTHRHFDPAAEMPGIVRICRLVEGMPLGIELAAAWAHERACTQIADEIAESLDALSAVWIDAPERHRSVRAAFESSWHLLSGPERTALSRLSVFRGGFTLAAANQIAGAGPEQLAALTDRSLLRRSGDDRFEIHELLRQYAADKLAEQGETQKQTLAGHGAFYLRLLQEQAPHLQGAEQAVALAHIGGEIDNVRAAWRWAVWAGQGGLIDGMIESLGLYYEIQSWYQEGFDAFGLAADQWAAGSVPGALAGRIWAWQGRFAYHLGHNEESLALEERARDALDEGSERVLALNTIGNLLTDRGDYARAEQSLQEALVASRTSGDLHDLSLTLASLLDMDALRGQFAEAETWAREGLEACQQTGDRRSIAVALGNLGRICGIVGEYEQAGQHIQAALDIYRALDSRRGIATSLHNLSTLAYIDGDYARTRQLRLEALQICRDIGFRWGVASSLKGLGDVARQMGDHEQALRYLDESLTIHRALGDRWNEANLLNSLAGVAREQGSPAQSWQFYRQALQIASDIEAGTVIVAVLSGMAGLLAAQGQDEQALEVLAFALAHPAGEQQSRADMEQLQSEVSARLPARAAQAAQQRGQAESLAEIAVRLLR